MARENFISGEEKVNQNYNLHVGHPFNISLKPNIPDLVVRVPIKGLAKGTLSSSISKSLCPIIQEIIAETTNLQPFFEQRLQFCKEELN